MEKLRSVKFFIEKNPEYGLFDLDDKQEEELKETTKERIGFFHRWGDETIRVNDKMFNNTFAIIEEMNTGKVFKISPDHIQFN